MAIGRPPADPSMIRFDDDCFVVVGSHEEWRVGQSALQSGPAKFGRDRERAEAYARRCNRTAYSVTVVDKERVKWF